jgi:Cof subfamily protein (haloacid dehalogenase superfamily)
MAENDLIKLVATDLDGTLLRDDKSISEADLTSLKFLAERKIVRVAATGRSMHKVKEVLPENTPFDFIVFSSGGGVYDWNRKALLISEQFGSDKTNEICDFLLNRSLNFFIYRPIPENNLFQFHRGAAECSEFEWYLNRHNGDYSELNVVLFPVVSGQFLSIIPNDENLFESIKSELNAEIKGIKVIRTTSPVDTRYIWLEIFPETVSKGHGLKWLCDFLSIPYSKTSGIGNDYNDQDMFNFVAKPFLLGNSPLALKKVYPSVSETNNESGFSKILSVIGF